MAREKKQIGGFICRFNALVEKGWLTVLTENQVKLWMAYAKYADRDGIAWPDSVTLSGLIGHKHDNHIARIRQSLVDFSLVEIVNVGGGRGNPCKVKLLEPPAAPQSRTPKRRKHSAHGSVYEVAKTLPSKEGLSGETLRPSELNTPPLVAKHSALRTAYKEEQTNELPKEQTIIHSARSASGAVVNLPPKSVEAEDKKLSLQARVMRDVWEPKWSASHFGANYCPSRVDFIKLAEILNQLGARADEPAAVQQFTSVIEAAFELPEEFGWQGHRLVQIQKNIGFLNATVKKKANGVSHANGKRNGASSFDAGRPAIKIREFGLDDAIRS